MDYLTWNETVRKDCPEIQNVRGGCMCRAKGGRVLTYCDLPTCPKVKDGL